MGYYVMQNNFKMGMPIELYKVILYILKFGSKHSKVSKHLKMVKGEKDISEVTITSICPSYSK